MPRGCGRARDQQRSWWRLHRPRRRWRRLLGRQARSTIAKCAIGVGIIAQDGAPTELWKALRAKDKGAYAAGIKAFYAGLFETYSDAHPPDPDEVEEESGDSDGKKKLRRSGVSVSSPVGLTVNIQLQLPPSEDGVVYDKFFEAMGKHLKGLIQASPDGD